MSELPILLTACAAAAAFGYAGWSLFAQGFESYETRYVKGTEKTLESLYLTLSPQQLFYLALLSGTLFGGLALLVAGSAFPAAVFFLLGLFLPGRILRSLKRRRDLKFQVQLVDALMSMENSLKAGFSLPQAFELIQREMENPIRQEFRIVVSEMKLGVPMEEALAHLYERMPSPDLDLIITSISIAKEVGGNLTEILSTIAHTIRDRLRVENRIRSLTANGRLQAWIMGSLPLFVALAINWLNPALIEPLYATFIGIAFDVFLLIWLSLGVFFIRKIVTIDV